MKFGTHHFVSSFNSNPIFVGYDFLTQGNLSELGDDSIRSGDSLGIHGEQIIITITITTITIDKHKWHIW